MSLVERLKSAKSLFSCSAVCSCLSPSCCVALCSPFYRRRGRCRLHQKKRRERKRKREKIKEKKPSRTAASFFSFMWVPPMLWMVMGMAPHQAPVHHWCYASMSSAGHGVPSHPSGPRGEPTCLSAAIRGLGSTTPTHPSLLAMRTPGVACRGHESRQGMPAPLLVSEA